MREKDYPVVNAMQYDRDGKLLYWDQEFLHGETLSAYTVEYDKNGQVTKFYNLDAGDDGYIYPTYSIHQLLDKLKKENIDLFHNISICYYGRDAFDADSVPYKRWGWYVDIKDTIDSNDKYNMTGRLYDGQTGELLDVFRGIWEDYNFNLIKMSNEFGSQDTNYRLITHILRTWEVDLKMESCSGNNEYNK